MRMALIQGMENANKTGVRFGWVTNGGLMEGVGRAGNGQPWPDHPTISGPAIGTLPSLCVDIFSPTKQASKQSDPFSGTILLIHWRCRLDVDGWRRILWCELRNRNAVNRQKPPLTSIFVQETNIVLLWRFEGKRS